MDILNSEWQCTIQEKEMRMFIVSLLESIGIERMHPEVGAWGLDNPILGYAKHYTHHNTRMDTYTLQCFTSVTPGYATKIDPKDLLKEIGRIKDGL